MFNSYNLTQISFKKIEISLPDTTERISVQTDLTVNYLGFMK